MQALRRYAKPLCWLLALAMVNLSLPHQAAWAAMLPTEAVIEGPLAGGTATDGPGARQSDRDRILALLQRDEVRAQLEAYGVGPAEAQARVESLSDREIARIAARLGEEPAGGVSGLTLLAFAGLILAAIVIGFWILFGAIAGTAQVIGENAKSADAAKQDDKAERERMGR
ncbi:MAG: PA2779 family protein [Rhodospirillales bacterium]|nr:PA2779 family protein [Rhodospirillales bacterium]